MQYVLEMTGFNPLLHGTETNYQKYDTKEEAIAFFEKTISKYPSIFAFKLYEAKEVDELPLYLQEQANKKWKADYHKRLETIETLKLINDSR